jgi:hypothetical protein
MPIRTRYNLRWSLVAVATCVLSLAIVLPAGAATTIGASPPGAAEVCVDGPFDLVQSSTIPQGQYTVPSGINQPVITSWSHKADSGIGEALSFKVFRKVAEPSTYVQVAHDGPRSLTPGVVNTFPVNLPVQAGDLIGINNENAAVAPNACVFTSTISFGTFSSRSGSLNDGQSGDFTPDDPGERVNVTAVVKPSNLFTLGATTKNPKKGTALLPVTIPSPGTVALSGTGLLGRSLTWGAGTISLPVKAVGKKKRKLRTRGKATVLAVIAYTPRGGDAATQSVGVRLKKNLPSQR